VIDRVVKEATFYRDHSLLSHLATIALLEKDKETFETHLSSLHQLVSNNSFLDSEDIEELTEELAKLQEKGDKAFPTDPMILKSQKV